MFGLDRAIAAHATRTHKGRISYIVLSKKACDAIIHGGIGSAISLSGYQGLRQTGVPPGVSKCG